MTTIKPCPFCGYSDSIRKTEQRIGDMEPQRAYCGRCEFSHYLARWNTRPVEDALQAEVDALAHVVDLLDGVEWTARESGMECCFCNASEFDGHAKDCELQAALRAAKGEVK